MIFGSSSLQCTCKLQILHIPLSPPPQVCSYASAISDAVVIPSPASLQLQLPCSGCIVVDFGRSPVSAMVPKLFQYVRRSNLCAARGTLLETKRRVPAFAASACAEVAVIVASNFHHQRVNNWELCCSSVCNRLVGVHTGRGTSLDSRAATAAILEA